MTTAIVDDIIARHAGREAVCEGELVTALVDRVYLQDGNSPRYEPCSSAMGSTEFLTERGSRYFSTIRLSRLTSTSPTACARRKCLRKRLGSKTFVQGLASAMWLRLRSAGSRPAQL